ncbi:conotoxin [Striga asiatica]|uniref:Conotoxin n=1 Tax=Striga asiatica TaxID=4170 RepID=A0A5A7QT28_STRAF|nr:conotoxin [Striga asiatica]
MDNFSANKFVMVNFSANKGFSRLVLMRNIIRAKSFMIFLLVHVISESHQTVKEKKKSNEENIAIANDRSPPRTIGKLNELQRQRASALSADGCLQWWRT